jgi:transposase
MLDKNLTFGGAFLMSKYSFEFKKKVVIYCLERHNGFGYGQVAKFFNIPSENVVKRWVRRYQEHGEKGLFRNHSKYDGNFKKTVVEYMHENHLSLSDTAIQFNLAGDRVVSKWERIYYEEGPQALFEERRGRKKKMSKPKKPKKLSESTERDLIAEVQQLRMEVAYLKKLNALVQERIKRENEKK